MSPHPGGDPLGGEGSKDVSGGQSADILRSEPDSEHELGVADQVGRNGQRPMRDGEPITVPNRLDTPLIPPHSADNQRKETVGADIWGWYPRDFVEGFDNRVSVANLRTV